MWPFLPLQLLVRGDVVAQKQLVHAREYSCAAIVSHKEYTAALFISANVDTHTVIRREHDSFRSVVLVVME